MGVYFNGRLGALHVLGAGSIPAISKKKQGGSSLMVECLLVEQEDAGSSPVFLVGKYFIKRISKV